MGYPLDKQGMLEAYYRERPVGSHIRKFSDITEGSCIYSPMGYSLVKYKVTRIVKNASHVTFWCGTVPIVLTCAQLDEKDVDIPMKLFADEAVAKLYIAQYKRTCLTHHETQLGQTLAEIEGIKSAPDWYTITAS